jgi:cytochrome c biogenesis protein CcmG/thiol:disulfide interchange protein DsbE
VTLRRSLLMLLPLLLLAALLALLLAGLGRDPRAPVSVQVGRAAPPFDAARLAADSTRSDVTRSDIARFASAELRGQVWLLNVWASWCAPCRDEHPALLRLAGAGVPVVGLNYKDAPAAARAWLQQSGDPYHANVVDAEGRIAIDYGVQGVPETFVIDRAGVVRWRHAGALTDADLQQRLLPLLAELKR